MNALFEGLKALGAARIGAMVVVAIGVFGMLALFALRGGSERMVLLYGDLDLRDSAQVVDLLARQHIGYQTAAGGSQVLVAPGDIDRARLALAKEALPSGGSIGYEIFDRSDNLTANQFQQTINETRALEGELARTIRSISGVRAARVHVVLPQREPFARDRQDAQAGVVLTMSGAARLDREGVQALLNLVAAAVPGLRPQNIAVVDSRGNVLSRAGEPTGPAGEAIGTEELRHATELRLSRAVEEMLERSLGPGRVRAEAAVDMDFERLNQTEEKFDPDGQVVRSSQSVNDTSKTTEQAVSVSVQNNLPNADAGNSGTGTQEAKQEETTNYEIGKTVRTLLREQPQIRRISLAVMVDGVVNVGADGKPVWAERPAEEIGRITTLVKGAIGFDEKRGDHVDVVSMRFAAEDAGLPAGPPAGLFGLPIEEPDLLHLGETLLLGLIAVMTLLLVVRPMVLRLTAPVGAAGQDVVALEAAGGVAALTGPAGVAAFAAGGGNLALAGPGGQAGGGGGMRQIEDESMVNMSNIEGQVRASSIRKVLQLVERHPEESVSVMRSWLAADAS